MPSITEPKLSLSQILLQWWRDGLAREGRARTLWRFAAALGEFVRESTPERRRRRYGDAEYDWDYRVDTTSATVGWRDRLLGVFLSPYQATEPLLFREMLESLKIDLSEFTFVDLGSGKGRALLMATDFPFGESSESNWCRRCMAWPRKISAGTRAIHRNASRWNRCAATRGSSIFRRSRRSSIYSTPCRRGDWLRW